MATVAIPSFAVSWSVFSRNAKVAMARAVLGVCSRGMRKSRWRAGRPIPLRHGTARAFGAGSRKRAVMQVRRLGSQSSVLAALVALPACGGGDDEGAGGGGGGACAQTVSGSSGEVATTSGLVQGK